MFRVFVYLKKYYNIELVYDPSDPCVDDSVFLNSIGPPLSLVIYKGSKIFHLTFPNHMKLVL